MSDGGLIQRSLIGAVRGYQLLLSPSLGTNCRYAPSCSAYALESLRRHGASAGACMAVCRVLRCHPLAAGGEDPVPQQVPGWLARLLGRPIVLSQDAADAGPEAAPLSSNTRS